MKQQLIDFIKNINGMDIQMELRTSSVRLVFGRAKYAEPNRIIVYDDGKFIGEKTTEEAVDHLLKYVKE